MCASVYTHICIGFVCASKETSTTAQKQAPEFDSLCNQSDGLCHAVDPGYLALSQTIPRHSSGASMRQALSPVGKLELAILFWR